MKIKSLIFPGKQVEQEDDKQTPKKYECPFDFCKKKPVENESNTQTTVDQGEKKDQ
jgi:hypothetical protein